MAFPSPLAVEGMRLCAAATSLIYGKSLRISGPGKISTGEAAHLIAAVRLAAGLCYKGASDGQPRPFVAWCTEMARL